MSFYDAIRVGASAATDFEIKRSLRFNDDDNAHLSRTPSSASNRKTWTISAWVKRGNLAGNTQIMFHAYDGSASRRFQLAFNTDNKLLYNQGGGGSGSSGLATSDMVFRDPSAWYHLVFVADYTNGTAGDRLKVYVNGSQISLTFSDTVQNADGQWNGDWEHEIGVIGNTTEPFDGYMAEINFIDGTALTPSSFGETNSETSQWNPKKYAGSYGTNGFYLNFSDNSGTTATTLGKDSSGNGNNFTPNNFSVAAGVGNDSLEDTPTNNFPTLNPLYNPVNSTLSEGNLLARGADNFAGSTFLLPKSGKWYVEFSKYGNGAVQAISVTRANTAMTNYNGYLGLADMVQYVSNGELGNRSRGSTSNATAWSNDADIVVAAAVDMDNGAVYFARANTWQNSGDPTSGSSKTGAIATDLLTDNNGDHIIAVQGYNGSINYGMYVNFGQRPFTYTPPTGYQSICSANLPDPTILLPNNHFNTLLYTGNGGTQSITGLEFQPDWVWAKNRSGANSNVLFDAVRGATKEIISNSTNAEGTEATSLTSFDSNGFSAGSNGGINGSGGSYVAWNWDAGETSGKTYTVTVVSDSGNKYRFDGFGTSAVTLDLAEGGTYIFNYPSAHPLKFSTTADGTHGGGSEYTTGVTHNSSTQVTIVVAASAPQLFYYCSIHSGMGGAVNTNSTLGSSNFAGSIQSTAKVNASAGFSIVGYTGINGAGTIGHGLGVAPRAVIIRRRDSASDWAVFHAVVGNTKRLVLNSTAAESSANSSFFNNTSPTSTTISLGSDAGTGGSTDKYIVYAFSEVAGYSKFGSYTGNGNASGTFVFLGFRPAWVMFKSTSNAESWQIKDNKRVGYNDQNHTIFANNSNTEYTTAQMDLLSNGFKLRNNGGGSNGSGESLIYFAFAESPFKNSRAR